MTTKQIEKRLAERRGELERVGGRLDQIQAESNTLSIRLRHLQGAILEMENMLAGPPLKPEDIVKGAEAGDK